MRSRGAHAGALNAPPAQPDVRDALAKQGAEATPSTPEAFAAQIRSELAVWAKVVKDADIKLDWPSPAGGSGFSRWHASCNVKRAGRLIEAPNGRNAVLMATSCGAVAVSADGPMTVVDVVRQIPIEELEMRMERFRDRVPAEDLRYALVQRIGSAPLDQFGPLQSIYMNHFRN